MRRIIEVSKICVFGNSCRDVILNWNWERILGIKCHIDTTALASCSSGTYPVLHHQVQQGCLFQMDKSVWMPLWNGKKKKKVQSTW